MNAKKLQDLVATVRAAVLPRFEQLAEDVPSVIQRRPLRNGAYGVNWLHFSQRVVFLGHDESDTVARVLGTPTCIYMGRDGRLLRLTVAGLRDSAGFLVCEQGTLSRVSEDVLANVDPAVLAARMLRTGGHAVTTLAQPAAAVARA